MTLEQSIYNNSISSPNKVAAICGGEQITYFDLWENIKHTAAILEKEGLQKNRPYVFTSTQDINFIITYCAVHHLGAIAVPLEAGAADERIKSIQDEVTKCEFSDDITDILYTTGTTGKAKGVMLSSTCLEACADNFIHDLHFTSELLFIISGPLNHIASLFKMHPVLTIGGTVCILDGLKDLNAFFDIFNLPYRKFATFLVPASIRMLLQFSYDEITKVSDKIDFIETGAAPITRSDMQQLAEALPHSRLYNTYGGTEIGCVSTYNFNDGKYMEGCIGRPMKNSSVEVTEDGNVIVSGKTIMSGYVNDEQNTRQVLRDGKIHGSDLGYVDESGMIHLKGRQGDVINVGGFKVDPVEVESAASSHPSVKDCICIRATHPVIGTVLKLLLVPAPGAEFNKRELALHIKSRVEPHKVPTYYEVVEEISRTYNGKLNRKNYI